MRLTPLRIGQLFDLHAVHQQRISDERAVAAPGYGLRAHERQLLVRRGSHDLLEAGGESGALHVVGVAAKREIAPAGVRGIRSRFTQPAERRHVRIADTRRLQRVGQRVAVELRVVTRARHGAHVDQPLHAVYRHGVVPLLAEQLARGELRPVSLFDRVRTRRIGEAEIAALCEQLPGTTVHADLNAFAEWLIRREREADGKADSGPGGLN